MNGADWDPFGEHYPLSRITLKFAQKLGSKVANNSSSQVQVLLLLPKENADAAGFPDLRVQFSLGSKLAE